MYKEIKDNLLKFFKDHPFEGSSFWNSRRDDIGIEIWLKKEFDPFVPFEADFSYRLEEMIPEKEFRRRFDEVPMNHGNYIIDKEVTVDSFPKPERTHSWIPDVGELAEGVHQSTEGVIYRFLPPLFKSEWIKQGNYTVNEEWEKSRKTMQPFIDNIDLIINQIKDNIKDGELDYLIITKEGVNVDKKYYPEYIPDKERIRVFPNMSLPIDPYYTTKLIHPKIKSGNPPVEISAKTQYTINSALKDKDTTQILILNGIHKNLKNLTEIPDQIRQLKNLRTLVITEIPIKEIPSWIKDLKELRSLTISPSQQMSQDKSSDLIKEIPEELWELKHLQYLTISNTHIKKISKKIEQLNNLIELDISFNQLIDIPSSIGKLVNLEKLEIRSQIPDERTQYYYKGNPLRKSWVAIDSVNEGLSEDEYLKKYNVEIQTNNNLYSGLTNIPKSISQLKKLTFLDLSGNKELQLSNEISELTDLRQLEINEMNLKEIPKTIQNYTKLHTLSIKKNSNIKEIPVWINKLQNLKKVETYGCRFSVIPETLNKLDMPNLENGQELFTYINLPELPSLFLKQKRHLIKGWGESLEKLPDWIGMLSESIYNISIRRYNSKIKFTELPDSFGDLINLQIVSFDDNEISELPSSMKNLTNTIEIYLNSNKFTELPELIRHMKKLKVLSFAYNNIKEVPEWIDKFKNLRRLDVSESTEDIPNSILKLRKLTDKRIDHSQENYTKKFPGL